VKNGVPVELVEAAKRHMLAQKEFQKNSIEGLADAWSQAIAVEGRSSPDDDFDAIRKVTVKDVNRVVRAFLVNDTAITALMTPRQSGKPREAKGFSRGKESFPRQVTKPVELPSWARGVTDAPVAIKGEEPTVFNLANGLCLIVQTAKSSKSVSIYGRVKNNPNLQTPWGKEGVDDLLDGLFSFGTTTLDRLSFQAALDEIAADLSAGTSFSLEVEEKHFERGVELLADNLLHPALPEGAFKVVRNATVGLLTGQQKNPSWLAGHALKEALYPKGDPAQRQAKPELVKKLTLDNVKNYYRTVFRPDMTTMVVIGDITPVQAKAVIDKYFGSWQAEGPKPETEYRPVPANRPKT
jgi:zinc protease